MTTHYTTSNHSEAIPLSEIPLLNYPQFYEEILGRLGDDNFHCANYFGTLTNDELIFYFVGLDDSTGDIYVWSWDYGYYSEQELPSLTATYNSMHPFEREITENFGVNFKGNPYNKPLRFAHDRADNTSTINNYPFYTIPGHSVHEVNVGPIHAGIIEPGAFRFICNGEKILHMEVVLGYQHRGVERMMRETDNELRRNLLAETIAGDSAVSHSVAYVSVLEKFLNFSNSELDCQRLVALELERIAIHIGDTGALCADVGYQLGQVACEALRTIAINTTQQWCGNRFGKSLIRPFGTNHPLTVAKGEIIIDNVKDIRRRFEEVCKDIYTSPSVLSRFEDCGLLSRGQMSKIGAVGIVARASSLLRDIRATHPYGAYREVIEHTPIVLENGDVMSRAVIRYREVQQSISYILRLIQDFTETELPKPNYQPQLPSESMSISVVEGWRGEICHIALTDDRGYIKQYKIKDPSVHNWYGLSLAVRGAGISDFPINNKSFNLSYCGHDL